MYLLSALLPVICRQPTATAKPVAPCLDSSDDDGAHLEPGEVRPVIQRRRLPAKPPSNNALVGLEKDTIVFVPPDAFPEFGNDCPAIGYWEGKIVTSHPRGFPGMVRIKCKGEGDSFIAKASDAKKWLKPPATCPAKSAKCPQDPASPVAAQQVNMAELRAKITSMTPTESVPSPSHFVISKASAKSDKSKKKGKKRKADSSDEESFSSGDEEEEQEDSDQFIDHRSSGSE